MNVTPKIQLTGVTKRFGRKLVLDGVDLAVAPGQSLVIIGGSGSGKSVTLKCILGLIQPDSGSIKVDGREMVGIGQSEREAVLRGFGMLFQGAALFDSLRVWENVAFALVEGRGMERSAARPIALEKLQQVGLDPRLADRFPSELSHGMQKRVGLARAIAAEPEVIFFDEPTTGLDPIMADVINDLIVACVERLGATTITITHDMASARKIADVIAMIYRGKIVWCGPADQVEQSGNPYVEQFIHGNAEGPIPMDVRRA